MKEGIRKLAWFLLDIAIPKLNFSPSHSKNSIKFQLKLIYHALINNVIGKRIIYKNIIIVTQLE